MLKALCFLGVDLEYEQRPEIVEVVPSEELPKQRAWVVLSVLLALLGLLFNFPEHQLHALEVWLRQLIEVLGEHEQDLELVRELVGVAVLHDVCHNAIQNLFVCVSLLAEQNAEIGAVGAC